VKLKLKNNIGHKIIKRNLDLDYSKAFVLLLVFAVFVITAFRLFGLDPDNETYRYIIQQNISDDEKLYEVTFIFFRQINGIFFNDPLFVFFIYALLAFSVKAYVFLAYSKAPLLSFLVFICGFALLHEYTQIRAAVAVGVFLTSISDLQKGDFYRYILKVLIAIAFHWSSIILVPLYFLVRNVSLNKHILLLVVIVLFSFSSLLLNIDLLNAVNLYLSSREGVNPFGPVVEFKIFNLLSLSQLMIVLVCFGLHSYKHNTFLDKTEITMLKILAISIGAYFAFASIGLVVLAFRVSAYLNVVQILFIPAVAIKFRPTYFSIVLVLLYFSIVLNHMINTILLN
jgi:transmembrane protein EpsG